MSKVIDNIEDIASIDAKANLASPTFTGTPLSTTPTNGDNSTKITTTAFVIQNGIPSGGIILWSGAVASIPAGWYLCDGANGTPDLRNRFIIGASVDNVGVSNTTITGSNTKTGGSKDSTVVAHTHTANHSHTGSTNSTGAHTHTQSVGTGIANAGLAYNNGSGSSPLQTSSAGAHSHTVTVDSASVTTSSAGSSGTDANLPPYYALAYIMKL